jgi:hypothetical protein
MRGVGHEGGRSTGSVGSTVIVIVLVTVTIADRNR